MIDVILSTFFNFSFQCCYVSFKYVTVFWEDSKRCSLVWLRGRVWGHNHLFKIGLFNFSHYLWSPFLLVPNDWDLLWYLLVLSLPFLSLLLLWLLFFIQAINIRKSLKLSKMESFVMIANDFWLLGTNEQINKHKIWRSIKIWWSTIPFDNCCKLEDRCTDNTESSNVVW